MAYSRCCAPLHRNERDAVTAEQLMRSRYSAYVKGLSGYVARTWSDRTRPTALELDPEVRWQGLEVIRADAGGRDDEDGVVEFVARYEREGRPGTLHEVSRFVRTEGEWRYLDAVP